MSNDPNSPNQGEGDYESARRFNESERKFVRQHGSPRQPNVDRKEEQELSAAEETARKRNKEPGHDAIDEEVFREEMDEDDKE